MSTKWLWQMIVVLTTPTLIVVGGATILQWPLMIRGCRKQALNYEYLGQPSTILVGVDPDRYLTVNVSAPEDADFHAIITDVVRNHGQEHDQVIVDFYPPGTPANPGGLENIFRIQQTSIWHATDGHITTAFWDHPGLIGQSGQPGIVVRLKCTESFQTEIVNALLREYPTVDYTNIDLTWGGYHPQTKVHAFELTVGASSNILRIVEWIEAYIQRVRKQGDPSLGRAHVMIAQSGLGAFVDIERYPANEVLRYIGSP